MQEDLLGTESEYWFPAKHYAVGDGDFLSPGKDG
jgi:hypothetical protein